MRPAVLIPIVVFTALCVGGAWVEYSQHSGLMLQAASGDVAQLCAELATARTCPHAQRFRARAAKDPWSHPYQCRQTPLGLLIYTLGSDEKVGGSRRASDILCRTSYAPAGREEAAPCACVVGDGASTLLQ